MDWEKVARAATEKRFSRFAVAATLVAYEVARGGHPFLALTLLVAAATAEAWYRGFP